MKKFFAVLISAVLALTSAAVFVSCGDKDGGKIIINVDGGGQTGDYNTVNFGTKKYDTLEKLANEWNEKNDKFEVRIRKTSYQGSRDSLVPLLTQKRAPEIIYQMGTVLAEDMGKGFYVSLDDYLDQPNPYVEGNEKWRQVYDEKELLATKGPDGHHYYACLERIPIGIMYNKSIFKEAGLWDSAADTPKLPSNFTEFISAIETLRTKFGDYDSNQKVIPYLPYDRWYDVALESNVFSSQLDEIDVITPDGLVDSEELCRAYTKGLFSPNSDLYRTYLQLILDKSKYYPTGFEALDKIELFSKGQLAMMDVTGEYMVHMLNNQVRDFDIGVFAFPTVDKAYAPTAGNGFIGGAAGLGTGWWITNSASEKGEETVAACVDFMMFLTAPQNNGRMVNDLGMSLPIVPEADKVNPLFQNLVEVYNASKADPDLVPWHTFNSWSGRLTTDLQTSFVVKTNAMIADRNKTGSTATTVQSASEDLDLQYESAVKRIMQANGWTASRWN